MPFVSLGFVIYKGELTRNNSAMSKEKSVKKADKKKPEKTMKEKKADKKAKKEVRSHAE